MTLYDPPSLGDMISLQPLFFAIENHKQIAKLIIKTPKWLLTTTQGQYSPQILWEQLEAYMTDSASKSLQMNKKLQNN